MFLRRLFPFVALALLISRSHGQEAFRAAPVAEQISIVQDIAITEHTPSIRNAAVTKDGQYVVSLDNYNYYSLWSLGDGTRLRYEPLDYEDHVARAMAIHPNGSHFVTIDFVFSTETGRPGFGMRQYRPQDGSLVRAHAADWGELVVKSMEWRAAAISDDWQYVAGAGNVNVDGVGSVASAVVFRKSDGEVVFRNTDSLGVVQAVAFSSDGRYLATGGNSNDDAPGFVRVWDLTTGNLVHTLNHGRVVFAVAFAPDSDTLVFGGTDYPRTDLPDTVKVWDLGDDALVHALPQEESFTKVITISPGGETIVTGGQSTVNVWRMADGGLERSIPEVHSASLKSLSLGLDAEIVVSSSFDGTIKVTELGTGQILREIGIGTLRSAVINSAGRYVTSASGDGALRKWNRYTGELLHTSVERHSGPVGALSLRGGRLVSGGSGIRSSLRSWHARTLRPRHEFLHDPLTRFLDAAETYAVDRFYYIAATRGQGVKIWDGQTGELLRTLDDGAIVDAVVVTPGGETVVTAPRGGSVKFWRLSDGELLHTEELAHNDIVGGLALTQDGQYVVSGSMDGLMKVWRLFDYGLERTLTHPDFVDDRWRFGVRDLAISPDGQYLACGRLGDVSSVEIWRINDGSFVTAVTGHREPVRSIAFDATGSTIVTTGDDDVIYTWIVDPPMGIVPPSRLAIEPRPGLPAAPIIRATLHNVAACTLSVDVDPTKLVPAENFVPASVYSAQPDAAASYTVDGSTITVMLSAGRPVSLLNGFLVKLLFDVAPGADPGTDVALTWNVGATSLGGAAPDELVDAVYTIPVPRDTRITALSPTSVAAGVPSELVIYGANFTGATEVALVDGGDVPITTYYVINDGLIRAVLPVTLTAGSYHVRVSSPIGTSTSVETLTVTEASSDTHPPAGVTDLSVESSTTTSLLVQWTAPADTLDNLSIGTDPVAGYDLRVTSAVIDSETFTSLPRVPLSPPKAPGEIESAWVGPLESGRIYFVALVSTDDSGNRSEISNVAHGITLEDTEPPTALKQVVTAISDVQVTVIVESDEPARAEMKLFEAFGGSADTIIVAIDEPAKTLRLTAEGLTPSTIYGYTVELIDERDNSSVTAIRPITTLAFPDETPPSFVVPVFMGTRADNSVTLGWTASEPVTSTVLYGVTTSYSDSFEVTDASLANVVKIEGLEPLTSYHLQVRLYDLAGNGPISSDDIVLRTLRDPDVYAPQYIAAPAVVSRDSTSVTLTWATDVRTEARIDYGMTEDYGLAKAVSSLSTAHSVVLTKLLTDTRYYYRVTAIDEDEAETASSGGVFRTADGPDLNPPVVLESPVAIVGTDEVRIRYRTDEPAMSLLLLYEQAQGALLRVIPPALEFTTEHEVYVGGLEPGKTYYYHLTPFDMARNEPILRLRSFRTAESPDETPPVFVAGPAVAYSSDERVVIRWRTDEVTAGELWYQAEGDSVATSVVDPTLDWGHQVTITNLEPGASFDFAVVARDMNDNETIEPTGSVISLAAGKPARLATGRSSSFATSASPDEAAPVILTGPMIVGRSSQSLSIAWKTDEVGTSVVRYGRVADASGRLAQVVFDGQTEDGAFGRDHQVTLTNLTPGATYQFEVASVDQAGNAETTSSLAVASTTPTVDITAPRITEGPNVDVSDDKAIVRWRTDEIADSEVSYWVGSDPANTVTIGERTRSHVVVLTNLQSTTTYEFIVRSADLQDNGPAEVAGLTFMTSASADVDAPTIAEMDVSAIGDISAKIVWTTNEPSDSFVEFGTTTALGLAEGSEETVTDHEVWLTNLEPNTEYHFAPTSTDIAGNDASEPTDAFRTLAAPESDPPDAPLGVVAVPGDQAVLVTWNAVADGDVAGYNVYRTPDVLVATLLQDTAHIEDGLDNGTAYTYQVQAVDEFGNESALSTVTGAATPAPSNVPSAPTALYPTEGSSDALQPFLTAEPAETSASRPDAELVYTFVIARDAEMSDIVATSTPTEKLPGYRQPWWKLAVIELEHDSTYYWAAAASDGVFQGSLGTPNSFVADSSAQAVLTDIALATFAATPNAQGITVEWSGAEPNDRFVVLRSTEEDGPSSPISGWLTGETSHEFTDMAVTGGKEYYYRLQRVFASGATHGYGPVPAIASLPDRFALTGVAPNPFNPTTVIRFDVPRAEPMRLDIYNTFGQRVRTLVDGILTPGVHARTWDGCDDTLRELGSGTYFIRMEATQYTRTIKVTMVR